MGGKALTYGAEALNSSLPFMSRLGAGAKAAYNALGVSKLPAAASGFAGGAVNQVTGKGSVANTLGMAEDVVNVLPGSQMLKGAVLKGYTPGEGIKVSEDIASGDYGSAAGRVAIGMLPGDQSKLNPSGVTQYAAKMANRLWDSKPAPIPEMAYGGPVSPGNGLPLDPQALMQYLNEAQMRGGQGLFGAEKVKFDSDFMAQKEQLGDAEMAKQLYQKGLSQQPPTGMPSMTEAVPGMGQEVVGGNQDPFYDIAKVGRLSTPPQHPLTAKDAPLPESIPGQGLTPGQVPGALQEYMKKSGNKSLVSGAGQAVGSYLSQTGAPEAGEKPELKGGQVVGGMVSGATNPLAMSLGPWGMAAGAVIGGVGSVMKNDNAQGDWAEARAEEKDIRLNNNAANAKQFSTQSLSQYDQQGAGGGYYAKYGGPLHKYYMGGSPEQVDYETEKSEVILASPNDRPIAVGQGGYKQLSSNLYKGNGPSHAQGGIPTRGATEPFVDPMGEQQGPYVFSDSKDMSFDATEILSMIR